MTAVFWVRVTVQVPVPEQPPPLQPVKVKPAPGAAARVTGVPLGTVSEQSAPQLMAVLGGVLVTDPVPCFTTVSTTEGTAGTVPQASLV